MSSVKILTAGLAFFLLASCAKDKKVEPVTATPADQTAATVAFDFKATINNKPLLVGPTYTNAVGDSFTVTKFNYYITNLKLTRDDGVVFAEPNSYRINRHADGPCTFTVTDLPDGTYNKIEFLIGVDSTRNSSGAQTGALDVTQGMYWDWNTGYVFFKLEGNYKTQLSPAMSLYAIHVGTTKYLKKCSFLLGASTISARRGKQSRVTYNVNIDEVFTNPTDIDMDTYHAVSGSLPAGAIAQNYKDMFTVTSVEN